MPSNPPFNDDWDKPTGDTPTGEPQPQIPGVTFFVYKRDGSMEISTDPYRRDYVSYQDFTVAEARITELEFSETALLEFLKQAGGVLAGQRNPLTPKLLELIEAVEKRRRAALAGTPRTGE